MKSKVAIKFISSVFIVVGIIFLILSFVLQTVTKSKIRRCSYETTAHVVGYEQKKFRYYNKSGNIYYFPVYEFEINGETVTVQDSSGSFKKVYEENEQVTIHCNPENPEDTYMSLGNMEILMFILGVIGGMFGIGGAMLLCI